MKRIILALLTCGLVIALAAPNAMGVNDVVVESKQVAASATGVTVGVHVENDVDLSGIVVPLELREVTAGSYIASSFSFAVQGRVGSSGLTDFPTSRVLGAPDDVILQCSGPVSNTYSTNAPVDFVSPDAVLWVGVATTSPFMPPGNDGLPGVGTPSFLYTFDVTGVDGFFEIDTCCVTPANHLQYVDGGYGSVFPTFTKGVVTIGEPPPPNNPPVAQCVPGGINTPPGLCERASIDPSMIDDGSYDPDAGDVITLSVFPAGPYPAGVHDIWLVVTDSYGLADTCQTTLTVVDDEDPVVTCPGDVTVGNDPDECGAIVTWDPATATDNCGVESVSCDPASGTFFPIGATPVECVAVDVNGNEDTCTFTVTVEDTQPPAITGCPPDDITVPNDPDECSAIVALSFDATDNCPGVVLTGVPPGSVFPVGVTPVEVIATDDAGNADTCAFTVTVNDEQDPVANCPGPIVVSNDPGQCGAVVDFAVDGSDNCPGVTQTFTPASGSFFPIGTTPVEVVATDEAGNTDICYFDVTVNDDDDPVLSCGPDITVPNDPDECGAIVNYESNISVVDNCPGLFVVGTPTSGSLFPVGTTQIEVVATDASDNVDTCYFNVIVEDGQAPVIAGCPASDHEVSNDPGECGATLSFDGMITATDNCDQDVALTGVPVAEFFPIGTTPVSITATDDDGNSALCEFNVVVTDDELPTAICPNDTAVIVGPLDTEAVVTWTSTVEDNCLDATITCNPPSGSTFPLGPTLVTCTAVDDAGNFDQCTFTVTVTSELVPPVAQCTNVTVVAEPAPPKDSDVPLCANWDANIDAGSFDPDGGPVTMVQEPPPPYLLGPTLVKLIVTDDEGDMDTCEATVTVVDETPPIVDCIDSVLTAAVDEACVAILEDYTLDGAFMADDACDVDLDLSQYPAPGTPLGPGVYAIWIIAEDDYSNKDSCSFSLAVVDTTPPTLACPTDPIEIPVDDICEALTPDLLPLVLVDDNCTPFEQLTYLQDPAPGTPLPLGGPHSIGFAVRDAADNLSNCAMTIFVVDTIPPMITCPGDTTIPNDPGQCGAMWYGSATADDNCALDYVLCNPVMPPPEKNGGPWLLPIGPTLFECVAVDMAGNQTTCFYTVTVEDTELPTVLCQNDTVVSTCDPAGAFVQYSGFVDDNCDVVAAGFVPDGDFFPPGVTTVMHWAEDHVGNRDSCFFDVTVNFEPPRFVATPDTLWFVADCAENPDQQCVTVDYDPGNCPVDKDLFFLWMASANQPWIMVAPPSGGIGDVFCVNLDAASLAPGDHEGLVYIEEDVTKPINGTWPDSVVIMLTVNDIGFDQIAVSPDTLFFEMDFDNPGDGLCQWVSLSNEGCGETCWQLFDDPASWITVSPTGGWTPDDVEVCVDPCNLPEGEYIDTLIFCVCPDSTKEPKVPGCAAVLVKMNVLNPPILMVDPTHLIFNEAIPGDHAPKQVDVTNIGGGSLQWVETHKEPWLLVNPSSGPAPGSMDVSIDFASLMGPDTLRDTIMVSADCALFSPLWVIVDVYLPCDDLCGIVMLADDGPGIGAVVQAWTNWPDGIMINDDLTDMNGMFCLDGLGAYDGPFDIRIVKQGYCTKIVEDVACGSDFFTELEPIPYTADPAWPFFADYWSVDARVFGVPLMPGDVILAMDPDGVLCGVTTVEIAGEYLIHVLGNDPNTPGDEGAEPGDQITLLLNCGCPAIAPDPWVNQGDFEFDVNFECNRKTIECDLCYPWNLVSFNVVPTDPALEAVLGSIDGKYDRVYSATCSDGSLSWELDRPINDLTTLTHMHGFGLRVTEPGLTLIISGFEFPVQAPLALCEGWNLMPYWPDEPDTLTHALASIAGLYEQIIGFECDGAHTWVAGRPINDLFCLEPCNGYWIKMTQAATLTYPIDDYSCGVVDGGPLPKVANRIDRLSVTPYQADFWSTADPTITGVVDGDVVTAYTIDGTLCGEAVVGAAGAFLMHVYGDDPSTPQVEGAVDGERLSFRVTGEIARVVEGSAVWSDRGSNQVTLLIESAGALLPTEYTLFQNYPNPFNPSTAIRFHLRADANVSLVIYNVLGQVVRDLHKGHLTAGEHTLTWNGKTDDDRSAQSGVYFYRIATSDWTDVKKMTLLK